jgi:hypothetical protein
MRRLSTPVQTHYLVLLCQLLAKSTPDETVDACYQDDVFVGNAGY